MSICSTAQSDLPAGLRPLTVSVKAGRALIGLGNTKFYELIGTGEIRTMKCGAKTLVVYQSLEAFVARHAKAA
jgi:hypothetical protein